MGSHAATEDPMHVLYVGSSADLGALRRLMEAHGAVTRSRLTPAVTLVVADPSIPAGRVSQAQALVLADRAAATKLTT